MKIIIKDKVYNLKGFLDTGNTSEDEFPVIFIKDNIIKDVEISKGISIKTVIGNMVVYVIKPDKFYIKFGQNYIKKEVFIGVSENLKKYDVLLNLLLFMGGDV